MPGCSPEEPPPPLVLRIGHPMAPGNNVTLGYEKFKELVERKSEGRILIKLYPDAVLGNDLTTMNAVQAGELEMASSSTQNLADISRAFIAIDLPYITRPENLGALYASLDQGDLGSYLEAAARSAGLKPIMWSDYGYRNFATISRRLRAPGDAAGLRLRTTQSPVDIAIAEALGARPVPLIWADTYPALLRGSIDGESNTYSLLYTAQHYEVLGHVTETRHTYSMHALMMNLAYWNGLDEESRRLLAEAAREALAYERSITRESEQAARRRMLDYGLAVTELTDRELEAWREALRPVLDKFREEADPELVRIIRRTQLEGGRDNQ